MIVGAAVVVVAAVAAAVTVRVRREREWVHGGDVLKAEVEVIVATPDTFDDVAVRLSVPPGEATAMPGAGQSVVVRVRWSGLPPSGGFLELLVLDGRVSPPLPLAADGGWNAAGGTGTQWSSAYETLAEHYGWLGGVARALHTDADGVNHLPNAAVHAGTGRSGTVTGWFHQWADRPVPLADPHREVVVALVNVDDHGEVRWARRVFG
jgi:hypothetical protein